MRPPAPLPERFARQPFRVADAAADGVHIERMRRADLDAPFWGLRSAPITGIRSLAEAYAQKMPPHHALAGVSAARLWGLPVPEAWTPDEALVIARPAGATRGRARGTHHITVDSTRLSAVTLRGLRLLTPAATTLTLARELDHEHLVHVVDALLATSRNYPDLCLPARPYLTPAQLDVYLAERAGLRGAPALRAAAADARPGVDSRFESITRRIIVRAGLPEPAVHPAVAVGRATWHPDLGYPLLRIAVEYEGDGHRDARRWADDIVRYEALEAAGWIVVRITRADLARGGDRVVRRVRAALARRV